jgi:serine/threonine protein kinase
VYLGREKSSGKGVAVKIQHITPYSDSIASELYVIKGLEHENVTAYVDSFLAGTTVSIVMEYVHGVSAERLAARCKLPSTSLAAICHGVLPALAYMHNVCQLMHRDIQGANILLDTNGAVKLTDFGLTIPEQYSNAVFHGPRGLLYHHVHGERHLVAWDDRHRTE